MLYHIYLYFCCFFYLVCCGWIVKLSRNITIPNYHNSIIRRIIKSSIVDDQVISFFIRKFLQTIIIITFLFPNGISVMNKLNKKI